MQCISWFYNHYYKTLDLIEKIFFKVEKLLQKYKKMRHGIELV